ncbi:hypothetical protein EB796_017994 [Bugula neritina]|uniref:Uncharacterized protein n=1 Tax=Bugula neritina TaxID=10212 RepID=A0A7J7JE91_BUGNE|nr:hypothetical protein EB796_017994 [Bugula neritina]
MACEEKNVRVNGSQLRSNVGNQVLLLGKGIQCGNMSLKMEACDGQKVDVKLLQQPDGNTACHLEVVGTVTGPSSVTAREVTLYPEWDGVFDMETYNSALETIHSDQKLQEYVLGMH